MKKICLVIPNFGKFPNYFDLWVHSAEKNTEIDFFIFTDVDIKIPLSTNIKVIKSSLHDVKKRLENVIGQEIILEQPYKLCDYKPFYGLAFKEYLKEYEFWGHCDLDLIWGNVNNFLTEKVLQECDRIYDRGHLIIYRNIPELNTLAFDERKDMPLTWREMIKTNYICHFDEMPIWNKILRQKGMAIYEKIDYLDVRHQYYRFVLDRGIEKEAKQIYSWENGKIIRTYLRDNKLQNDEWIYVHLQKRDMKKQFEGTLEKFDILPDGFDYYHEKDVSYVEKFCPAKKIWLLYWKKRVKEIIVNLKNGALMIRWIRRKRELINAK